MSKRDSRQTQRSTGRHRRAKRLKGRARSGRTGYWVIAGGVVLVLSLVLTRDAAARHPDPRPSSTKADVKSASAFGAYPRVAGVYGQARAIPRVLDGLYCYCHCSEHAGHYSLLDCFKSDHGAACDVCLSEAAAAFRMTQDGQTLDEIRGEVDRLFKR